MFRAAISVRSAARRLSRYSLPFMLAMPCLACAPPLPETEEGLFERPVFGNVFDTRPPRGQIQPLRFRIEGEGSYFEWMCLECHNGFGGPKLHTESEANPEAAEHRTIKETFYHGEGISCLNCHHPANRIFYVDREGSEIPTEDPDRLCAKCHAPIAQDWQAGLHGRRNGHWDLTKGPRSRLSCIQCHDPHLPKAATVRPDPAPARSRLASREEPSSP